MIGDKINKVEQAALYGNSMGVYYDNDFDLKDKFLLLKYFGESDVEHS